MNSEDFVKAEFERHGIKKGIENLFSELNEYEKNLIYAVAVVSFKNGVITSKVHGENK